VRDDRAAITEQADGTLSVSLARPDGKPVDAGLPRRAHFRKKNRV
jgi:hypothetical protein